MTASKQAKAAGLKSLAQVSELTGVSFQTLNNWAKHKPELFHITLLGCKAKLAENALTCPRCKSDNASSQWKDNSSIGQYQLGDCGDCGHLWNESYRAAYNFLTKKD